MKISVIIPTNKPKLYFCDCLNSLSCQTFSIDEFEIIIILNGDINNYDVFVKDIIKTYIPKNNVQYFTSSVANVSISRNLGIDNAKGQYITFIDDDDYVSPTYLEEMYNLAIQGFLPLSNVIAFDNLTLKNVDNLLSKLFYKYNSNPTILNVRTYFSNPVGKLLSRSIIKETRFNSKYSLGEDGLFMLELSSRIAKLSFTSTEAVYFRRVRGGSATTRKRVKQELIYNSLSLIKAYLAVYINSGLRINCVFLLTRVFAELLCIIKVILSSFKKI